MSNPLPERHPESEFGCLVLVGVILLVPGLCSLFEVLPTGDFTSAVHDPLWIFGLSVGAVGVALIILVIWRGRRR
jgi:hypothetical protein